MTIAAPRLARLLMEAAYRAGEFDESKHNRDQRGRFSRGDDYGEASPEVSVIEQKKLGDAMASTAAVIVTNAGLTGMGGDAGVLGGKIHEASHVERGAVKEAIVQELGRDLIETTDLDDPDMAEGHVQARLNLWAETSGDSDPRAIMMQRAVAEEFGLEDAALNHLKRDSQVWAESDPVKMGNEEKYKIDRKVARAEYDATQRWFKEKNITHVSLFRGMSGVPPAVKGESVEVTMQPASSWSIHYRTAHDFATERKNPGSVIAMRIPVSRVLSTAVTGRGCLNEGEVVVLGGKKKVKVIFS